MPSTARSKMNSIPSFVCAWNAHGSPSIVFYSTLHKISSLWSLYCARHDKRSISA